MPCYDPPITYVPPITKSESDALEKTLNGRMYGFHKTNSELIPQLLNMCCEMSGVIFDGKIQHRLSHETLEWCEFHRFRDEKIKQLENDVEHLKKLESQKQSELKSLTQTRENAEKRLREARNTS